MDRIDHSSKDILGGNIDKIAEIFPGVVTEATGEDGKVTRVIDFDLLRQHLSDSLVEGDRERFRLDWPGKKASILKANTPTTKTLRPVREDSVDFDTTQNVFIEGDNFEVLKVLQESYLGKIKMIYIDPPYNTGKDFIYRDNTTEDKEEHEERLGVFDDETGGRLIKNTETNGRYHSDWLSMMQERLIVARDLLTDDGVIFISIDDNEQANLKKLCDEVFGQENYIAVLPTIMNLKGNNDQFGFAGTHEYSIAYSKNISSLTKLNGFDIDEEKVDEWLEDETGPYKKGANLKSTGVNAPREKRPNLFFPIYININANSVSLQKQSDLDVELFPITGNQEMSWRWSREKIANQINDIIVSSNSDNLSLYKKQRPELGELPSTKPKSVFYKPTYSSGNGTAVTKTLFDGQKFFDNPKPVELIKDFIKIASGEDSIVLDFFSGSGTTAHAVMQLNAEDGGNRRHIQVQLAEATSPDSEAYKAGYKTIPEISRERIRRAGAKIRADYAEQIVGRDTPLDTGFRAYRLSSTNFADTAKHPDELVQSQLLSFNDTIKPDRTAEDILTETILDLGLTLDLPIESRDIAGHTVYFVNGNSLVACFDDSVHLDIVEPIAAEKPLRVVFKDSSFASDEVRINIDIKFKQLSPDTEVKVV